ncbi:MAG: twin-arginine translocation signal domain-containing protein, partial [Chloroflexota bacterium]|nr:twin-arginine translocation signal domain-containing protein [Chloroflexota bacterium]
MTAITEPPQPQTAPHQSHRARISRRMFLKRAGIGAGAVIVVAGTGTTWHAADQGVFSTDAGAAYRAWGEWDAQGGGPLLPL